MKNSYQIVEISFSYSNWDCTFEYEFNGTKFNVQRIGTNFSIENIKQIIHQFRQHVDAFALTGMPAVVKFDDKTYLHKQYLEVINYPSSVPICDGSTLREISNLKSLKEKIEMKEIDPSKGVFFPLALMNIEIEEYLRRSYPENIHLGDAFSLFGLPFVVRPFSGLKTIAKGVLGAASFRDLRKNTPLIASKMQKMTQAMLASQIDYIQYVVADLSFLLLFERNNSFLSGKDLIIWTHHPEMQKEIEGYNPRRIFNLFPDEFLVSPYMNYSLLDATLRLAYGRSANLSINEWENLLQIDADNRTQLRKYYVPQAHSTQRRAIQTINKFKQKIFSEQAPDFAFIIHALSHKDFMKLPGMKILEKMPSKYNDSFDRLISHAPPFVYGKISNIMSAHSGKTVNGIVYGLLSTPKVLKEQDPVSVYAKIHNACTEAADRGAKIIGLGAYTKIVGDSGVTINKNSPIPVTTGNSLSASATLWALYNVTQKMSLLTLDAGSGLFKGTAMVIGATGSIGKVSAKMLSMRFNRLVLVAPRRERLEDLAREIEKMSPRCQVIVSTDANEFAKEVDALVTATSAFDAKVVEVMRLKPGCVVCDCSRPLDFNVADAKKRPDVLIIESGEVELPGPVDLQIDLGLPGKAVYACLAETALLALEERYEAFTLGRDIEWSKVQEIYHMAKKHGIKLAAIQGHMGTITDKEIQLTRELAVSRRQGKK